MSSFTYILLEYFRSYNILFLSILIVLQCIGIPTGATLIVIASGAFAYAGEFNIVIIFAEIWFFAWIGDNIAYFMWRAVGEKLLNKSSRAQNYFEPKLEKSKDYLERHGKSSVFFTRFLISALGPFINAAAGMTKYRMVTFSFFVALGELFWTGVYFGLGYWFGDSWEMVVPMVTEFGQILTYIAILMIIVYFLIKLIRKRKYRES